MEDKKKKVVGETSVVVEVVIINRSEIQYEKC